jgi:hypothetical protein
MVLSDGELRQIAKELGEKEAGEPITKTETNFLRQKLADAMLDFRKFRQLLDAVVDERDNQKARLTLDEQGQMVMPTYKRLAEKFSPVERRLLIQAVVRDRGVPDEQVVQAIDALMHQGTLYSPKPDYVKATGEYRTLP